jgi:HD domain
MDDPAVAPAVGLSARRIVAGALYGLLAVALVPAYIVLAPASHWDDPAALVALAVLVVIADRHDVPLVSGVRFDAVVPLALITVALAGPLPALAIALLPILTGKKRVVRVGSLANAVGSATHVLIGALVLEAVAGTSGAIAIGPALFAIGLVMLLVNWAVVPAIYTPLWSGAPPRAMVRMLCDALPAATVMFALGAATVVLSEPAGVLALALFAAIAIVPQTALTYAARTRPVARLDPLTATRRYAHALSVQLGLRHAERRHVDAVVRTAAGRPATPDPLQYARVTLADPSAASCHAGHVSEWWDGSGGPAGLHGELVPLAARIFAVADTWSGLTADGTRRLSHAEALAELQTAAGTRFDPRVVAAAHAVLRQERATDHEQAMEPRLHHLRVPAPLRRALAAAD